MSLKRVCIFPRNPIVDPKPDFGLIKTRLLEYEIIWEKVNHDSNVYHVGNRFPNYFEIDKETLKDNSWNTFISIEFKDYSNDNLGIAFFGPGINNPVIPGTDIEVENWGELIEKWISNRTYKYHNSKANRDYFPYELDYHHGFGIGNHFIYIDNFQTNPKLLLLDLFKDWTGIDYDYCLEYI